MNWAEKKAMAYQAIGLEAWYSNELVLAVFCFAEARKHASIAYQKEFECFECLGCGQDYLAAELVGDDANQCPRCLMVI